MTKKNDRPIIIRRVKKVTGGHHGGAWKVAYADFMTAMMAFFLLLWILGNTDESKLTGIANVFTPDGVPLTNIGGEGVMKGSAMSEDALIGEAVPASVAATSEPDEMDREDEGTSGGSAGAGSENPWSRFVQENEDSSAGMHAAIIEDISKRLDAYAENIRIHERNGNIMLELIDLGSAPMFQSGRAVLTAESAGLVREIRAVLRDIAGPVAITGHTDSVPFSSTAQYGNWELSSDRANAIRRALVDQGLPSARIRRVAGAADSEPLEGNPPEAAVNRRVTIAITTQ